LEIIRVYECLVVKWKLKKLRKETKINLVLNKEVLNITKLRKKNFKTKWVKKKLGKYSFLKRNPKPRTFPRKPWF